MPKCRYICTTPTSANSTSSPTTTATARSSRYRTIATTAESYTNATHPASPDRQDPSDAAMASEIDVLHFDGQGIRFDTRDPAADTSSVTNDTSQLHTLFQGLLKFRPPLHSFSVPRITTHIGCALHWRRRWCQHRRASCMTSNSLSYMDRPALHLRRGENITVSVHTPSVLSITPAMGSSLYGNLHAS